MHTIDVWAQIITPRMAAAPWMEPLWRWTGQLDRPVHPTVQSTVTSMDKGGVSQALISAWHGPQGSLISNAEVSAQIDDAPDRLRGLASIDIRNPVKAVNEIRKWVDGKRFVGVRIVPWLWDLPPNHRLFYPIYVACIEAGVPLCTQIGHTGPLCRSEPGRLIPYLEEVLLDFPELIVVGGHVGFPWLDEVKSMTFKFPNFYVDTSAYAVRRLPPDFVAYMKGPGDGRVMFGTNWPMIPHASCLDGLEKLGLSQAQETAFRSGTARRIFKLPEPD